MSSLSSIRFSDAPKPEPRGAQPLRPKRPTPSMFPRREYEPPLIKLRHLPLLAMAYLICRFPVPILGGGAFVAATTLFGTGVLVGTQLKSCSPEAPVPAVTREVESKPDVKDVPAIKPKKPLPNSVRC